AFAAFAFQGGVRYSDRLFQTLRATIAAEPAARARLPFDSAGSTFVGDFNAHARSARSGRLSLVRLDELEQAVGAFAEDVQGRRVRNANETGRVERFPRRDRHTRFLQQGVGQIERRAE